MKSVLFSGCSFVSGFDMENGHQNPGHFSHILSNNLFGSDYTIDNIGISGYSNARIFLDTASALAKKQYDYAFVCWTDLNRYTFWYGLESSEHILNFTPDMSQICDIKANSIYWKKQQLIEIGKMLLMLNHSHYHVCDLVSYVNILISIAESKATKVFFVNSILPFDKKFFDHIQGDVISEQLTLYTMELINSHNRKDKQINQLYHIMHDHYKEKGGIREEYWLNLYKSFSSMRIDFTNDGIHPGLKSHKKFAEFLTEQFKKHN